MRIRTVKPEFWKSESNGRLSRDARLLFIGLFNHADDKGRFRAAPALIRSELFPYDDLSNDSVTGMIRELSEKDAKIILYQDAAGNQYGYIPSWKNHQKINKPAPSKLPPPPENTQIPVGLPEDSGRATGGLPEGRDQGMDQGTDQGTDQGRDGSAEGDKPPQTQVKRFTPPSIEEVSAYCRERGNTVDPQKWMDHYTTNGWKVGRNQMKDWRASIRTWEKPADFSGSPRIIRADHSRGFGGPPKRTDYSKGF